MNKLLSFFCLFIIFKTEAQTSVLKIADSLYVYGNYSLAITNYKLHKKQQEVSYKLAQAYQAIGNYEEALKYYKRDALFSPENQLAKYQYAKLLAKTKKFNAASGLFYELIDLDYKNPEYHYQLGLVLEKLKDSSSQNRFYSAYQLDSTHQKAIYQLAKFQLKNKNYALVEKYTNIGLQAYPNNAELISLKAQSYYSQEEYRKAIESLVRLINLNETSLFIYEKLSFSYAKIDAYDKAIEHLLIALEMEPQNASNVFILGQMYDRKGNPEIAEKYMKQALDLFDIPLDDKFIQLAVVLNQQKKYKEAIAILNTVIHENPGNMRACFFMVMAKDKYYKDVTAKLEAFQAFENSFPNNIYSSIVEQRISQLKSEEFNTIEN
ncbi:tetratricopeptide repeat protein [Lacinutrix sp. MEBiC02595]